VKRIFRKIFKDCTKWLGNPSMWKKLPSVSFESEKLPVAAFIHLNAVARSRRAISVAHILQTSACNANMPHLLT